MQGVGNDFVVFDAAVLPRHTCLADLALQVCDRHFGIGADGLLVVSRDAPGAAFRMQMFNPDGTEDMCGNGLRCVCLWAMRAGWLGGQAEFFVAAKDGLRSVSLLQVSDDARDAAFSADMGLPSLEPETLPFCAPPGQRIVQFPLVVGQDVYPITSVNTGSTHAVIFGEAPTEEVFQRVSPLIENHPLFPERTSVLWATPDGESRFFARIWERGAGETLGCGTGACAVGVAAVVNGLSAFETPLDIISRGGTLQITWPSAAEPVRMAGPAQFVFEGDFAL